MTLLFVVKQLSEIYVANLVDSHVISAIKCICLFYFAKKVLMCTLVKSLYHNHLPSYTEVNKYGNRPQEVPFSNFKKYDSQISGDSIIELK